MFAMLNQFFSMLSTLFSAGEKGARALDHLAEWSESTAASFKDEAQVSREKKMLALQDSLAKQKAAIAASNANAAPAP